MRKVRDFNWIANNGHFNRLSYGNGLNLFLLDTGTLIDMEKEYIVNTNGYASPAEVFDIIARQYPIIITPKVLGEIRTHKNVKIGKRREISEESFSLMRRLSGKSEDFLGSSEAKKLGFRLKGKFPIFGGSSSLEFDVSVDSIRYTLHLATIEAFKGDYRKGSKDRISETDKEMLLTAFLLSQGTYGGEKIGCVNILSPDNHLAKTVQFIKRETDLRDCNVRTIPTRNDLRSYLK